MRAADNVYVLPLCQIQGSSNTRRVLKRLLGDRGPRLLRMVLLRNDMPLSSYPFVHIAVFVMYQGDNQGAES